MVRYDWLTSIKNIIDSSGLSYLWTDQESFHQQDPRVIANLTTAILKSLEDQSLQNAEAEINGQNKLHLFKNVSKSRKPAPYLTKITNRNERSLFAKLRLGTLKLEIETGRHENLKSSERFCKLCSSNKIGDETHFLFDCPALDSTRNPILDNISDARQHFKYLSSKEKTKFLYFNNQLDNPTLCAASSLLQELNEKRSSLLRDPQPSTCVV